MTPEEFVSAIRQDVLEDNLARYREFLESARSESGPFRHWPRVSELYATVSEEQQRAIVEVIRSVIVDTLSNVFGILDGSTRLQNQNGRFHLSFGSDADQLNGDLQDLFLASET